MVSLTRISTYITNPTTGRRELKPNNILDANITQALFKFINSQVTPMQQFIFVVSPAMQWHATILIVDNRDPANPIFHFIDNHGEETFYDAKAVDWKYAKYIYSAWKTYTHDKKNKNKEVLRNGNIQSFIYYLKPN